MCVVAVYASVWRVGRTEAIFGFAFSVDCRQKTEWLLCLCLWDQSIKLYCFRNKDELWLHTTTKIIQFIIPSINLTAVDLWCNLCCLNAVNFENSRYAVNQRFFLQDRYCWRSRNPTANLVNRKLDRLGCPISEFRKFKKNTDYKLQILHKNRNYISSTQARDSKSNGTSV